NLPLFKTTPSRFKGTAGVGEWLGPNSPFLADLITIWADFMKIFPRRSDDKGTTKQVLFVCYTASHFDLIYSKVGLYIWPQVLPLAIGCWARTWEPSGVG
ncbi:MAG: hypothetical protein ACREXX_10180, partial [Gammaproteobacteria bacterium]